MFWRVELDKEGSIKSCDFVPEQGKNGGRVIYVEAETKAKACSEAKAWYARKRASEERCRLRKQAARKAQGHCVRCDRKATPGKTLCPLHLQKHKENNARHRSGKTRSREFLDPTDAMYRRRLCEMCRMSLIDVLAKFDGLGTEAFRAWLVSEIEMRKEKLTGSMPMAAE